MQSKSKLGTYTLQVLQNAHTTCVCQADTALLDQIATLANIQSKSPPHLLILAALERDARFHKEMTHVQHNGQSLRVRSFSICSEQHTPPTMAVQLPQDPWRRRQFVGSLLECDPHVVTPAQSEVVASLLPPAMALVAPVARERIIRTYGLDGNPPATAASIKNPSGSKVTVRSSIASSMERLGKRIRSQMTFATDTLTPPPVDDLRGDALLWERIDHSDAAGCWPWTGTLDRGYPTFKRGAKKMQVMKYLYELYYGPVPEQHYARPTCGNLFVFGPIISMR